MEVLNFFIDAIEKTNLIEWLAFATAILYVFLAAKEHVSCWIFGLISAGLYVKVCIDANLFLESILQSFYFLMAIYGWMLWKKKQEEGSFTILSKSLKDLLPMMLIGFVLSIVFGIIFLKFTSSALPILDSFITVFSLLATYLTAKKVIQNWNLWMIINIACIFLYASRGLYLTSFLYFIFAIVSVYGFVEWRKKINLNS